jgi:hypothetical protein
MANGFKTFETIFERLPPSGAMLRNTSSKSNFFHISLCALRRLHSKLLSRPKPVITVEQKDGVLVNSCGSIAIFKIPTYEKQIKAHYWRMHCGSGPFRAAHRANNAEEIGLFFALSKCKRVSGSFARQTKPASHSLSRDGFRDG